MENRTNLKFVGKYLKSSILFSDKFVDYLKNRIVLNLLYILHMFYKFKFIRYSFLIIYIIFLIIFLLSPNEAFAMEPSQYWITNYYGGKEYVGPNSYAYFHDPIFRHSIDSLYTSSYDNTNNPDYFIPDKSKLVELDGKPIYKSISTPYDRDELHFWTQGQSLRGDLPVRYYFDPKGTTTFELDSGSIEGSVSTNVNTITWHKRNHNNMEIIRDYCTYVDNFSKNKNSLLTKISLCVETTRNNITFIYLKCNEVGKRKIIWTIWERNRGKYDSYKEFKINWDSNSSILSSIKKDIREDIRAEVEDLLGVRKIKKDIRKSVRGEVEKLLRESRPFKC